MRCPKLHELPAPPPGKTGWPWTEDTPAGTTQQFGDTLWPKVSIVTPSFNQGDFIEETIRSVLLQQYHDLEYIVVDGGSKDNSVDIIRKYERWIFHWSTAPDKGVTNAVNKGFAIATGTLFGIMCADDTYMPKALATLVHIRIMNPEAVGVAGGCMEVDVAGRVINLGAPFIREPYGIGDWGHSAWFGAIACLFDGTLFRRIGECDERFKTANDVELWMRLSTYGKFRFTDEIVASARYNPNSISHRDPTGEIIALIAMNYIHDHRSTAKVVLERHVSTRIALELNSLRLTPKSLGRTFGLRTLAKAFLFRIATHVKARIGPCFSFRASSR